MARYLQSFLQGENTPKTQWFNVAASQTIKVGDIVQINGTSRLLETAVAASTTIVGIANADITTGGSVGATDRIPVILARDAVFRVDYTGSTKTTVADTDKFTTLFDLGTKTTVNLDDTTGGMCQILDYNNTTKTVDVVIAAANQFIK